MAENQCSNKSSDCPCIYIGHNGIGEERENEIMFLLFGSGSNGFVSWDHFNVIDKFCSEDDIHYAIKLLLERNVFNDKEGYALYHNGMIVKPTERLWGEELYFTNRYHADNFLKSSEMKDVCVKRFPHHSSWFGLNNVLNI